MAGGRGGSVKCSIGARWFMPCLVRESVLDVYIIPIDYAVSPLWVGIRHVATEGHNILSWWLASEREG